MPCVTDHTASMIDCGGATVCTASRSMHHYDVCSKPNFIPNLDPSNDVTPLSARTASMDRGLELFEQEVPIINPLQGSSEVEGGSPLHQEPEIKSQSPTAYVSQLQKNDLKRKCVLSSESGSLVSGRHSQDVKQFDVPACNDSAMQIAEQLCALRKELHGSVSNKDSLETARSKFSMSDAKAAQRRHGSAYSVCIFNSGGLGCLRTALQALFKVKRLVPSAEQSDMKPYQGDTIGTLHDWYPI